MNDHKSIHIGDENYLNIIIHDSDDPHNNWESIKEDYPCRDKDGFIIYRNNKIYLMLNPNFLKMFAFDMIDIDSKSGSYSYKQPFLFNNTNMIQIMKYLSDGNRLCDCKHGDTNQRNSSMIQSQCAIIWDNNDDIKKDINYYRNNYCSCVDELSNNRYIRSCPCHYLYVVNDGRDEGCCDNDNNMLSLTDKYDKNHIYQLLLQINIPKVLIYLIIEYMPKRIYLDQISVINKLLSFLTSQK